MIKYSLWIITLIIGLSSFQTISKADPVVTFLPVSLPRQFKVLPESSSLQVFLARKIAALIPMKKFESVKAKIFYGSDQKPKSVLVYVFSKAFHRVDFMKLTLNDDLSFRSIDRNYSPANEAVQYEFIPKCPDEAVRFISVAPHSRAIEQKSATDVADAAEAAGLKTIRLLKNDANKENFLNYMSCPNLIGNFYDGDANKGVIETSDGHVTAAEISALLKGSMRSKVTNIWVACDAYNDPMLSAMISDAKAQKYIAGKNFLFVGPSDRVAVCAMKAAIQHQPIAEAFEDCRVRLDAKWWNKWGIGGAGSDQFGE